MIVLRQLLASLERIVVFPEVAFSHSHPVVLESSLLYLLVANPKNLPSCGKNYALSSSSVAGGVRKLDLAVAGTRGVTSASSLICAISTGVGGAS